MLSTCVAPTKEQSSLTEARREALKSFITEAILVLPHNKKLSSKCLEQKKGG